MATHAAAGGVKQLSFSADLKSIRVYATPGEIVNRNFQLTTTPNARKAYFEAIAEDWWPSEDGKKSYFREPGSLERSCGRWMALNPVEAEVDPGQSLSVKISLAIPDDVQPGGHWCVLTVNELPDPAQNAQGVAVSFLASVSVGIFVYVEPVARAASILDVNVGPNEVGIRVENDGNTPLGVEGRIEFIAAGQSRPMVAIQVARRTIVLEPVRVALITSELPTRTELPSGRYLVRVILDIGLDSYIGVQKELVIDRGTEIAEARP
jgi:hypothetical protein